MSIVPQEPILVHEGISYVVLEVGGFGWSRGCGSLVEAIDGPYKRKRYRANIGHGISNLTEVYNWEQRSEYRD